MAGGRRQPRLQPKDLGEASITSLTHDGRGVTEIDGKVTFVSGALPGETARIRRVHKRRDFDEANAEEILVASPDRVEPKCRFFGYCGGCSLQHYTPEKQIEANQQTLLENFKRIGDVTPDELLAPLRGQVWNYRRKARLAVRWVPKKGRALVGFRERFKNYVADIDRCEILAKPVDKLIAPLSELITSLSIRARLPQIEVAVADNATAFVARVLDEPTEQDLHKFRAFADQYDVVWYLQRRGVDSVRPLDESSETLRYRLDPFGIDIQFSPVDFIQVNPGINTAMVEKTVDILELKHDSQVLDLFSGLGNFSLPIATRAGQVTGIEGDPDVVARAGWNARSNGIGNVVFYVTNLFNALEDFQWARQRYDRVVLDPPRAGAAELIERHGAFGASRVVYVSCHPATLARDAGMLVRSHGYRLVAAGVLDMFPHTTHVESMALFEKPSIE
ncbi:MAG: 23S rRNA (uracil(1939)-C(5))-methyltransferase RlmD [Gammaproteobacteria bacterium]